MYEYSKGSYIYRGGRDYGAVTREVKTISDKEAKYWDNLEKQIRNQQKNK